MKRPKQAYDPELEKAVRYYHECHRDSHIDLIGFRCSPKGESLLLVRVLDEDKVPFSVLDSCEIDYKYEGDKSIPYWHIKEIYSVKRKLECGMVEDWIAGIEDYPEDWNGTEDEYEGD